LDPKLSVGWVDERAPTNLPGIVPGRWHVVRRIDDGPDHYMAIVTPDGGYREPDSGVVFELQQQDLWNARARHDRERRIEEQRIAKERERERDREERVDELAARLKAKRDPNATALI